MDKTSERVNRQTLEFSNRVYEELSTIVCQRGDLRYFSYDHNDEKIDGKLERMFELLDDIYSSSIDKKSEWITSKPVLKPKKLVFPEEGKMPDVDIHTPEPRTPVKKEKVEKVKKDKNKKINKIKVVESDIHTSPKTPKNKEINKIRSDLDLPHLDEDIMYSSEEENISDGEFEKVDCQYYIPPGCEGKHRCIWCSKWFETKDIYDAEFKPRSNTEGCMKCIKQYGFKLIGPQF
jgi:hypothetical protein